MSAVPAPAEASVGASDESRGHWDWWLLLNAGLLMGFGLLMILSTTSVRGDALHGDAFHYVARQGTALLLGLAAGLVVLWVPWRLLRRATWPAYLLSLVALFLVMTPLGHEANGATRWISLGGINFQPSELAKVTVLGALANYLAGNAGRLDDLAGTSLPGLVLVCPAIALVLLQPDFGTTVLLCGLVGALYFVAGLRWRWVLVGLMVGGAALVLLALVAPYRVERLVAFRDPFADPQGGGYQVVQGWIAMANGGLTGQGLGTGVAQSGFLPEAHNDFIAAVVAEEIGAVGWLALVLGQLGLVWRGTTIAGRARDLFGLLVACGVTVLLGAQAVVNLGVVAGWLPNKGLVLPFVSYGASAAVIHMICVALLLRVGLEARSTALEDS